uniref:protocadherin gamma-C4-like isoform X6 n=1 Tax=Agelaius phoeniceus TaxID=39638 RepID=UPI0023EAEB5F|nr:protocadherin gamma-C4-like isoform X6 [Agelaius phoeniceus]
MGSNSISTYELSPSKHFALSINMRGDGVKMPEIVLEKALDREKVPVHHLTLTALDGGNPVKSGTARVTIHVLDANDNPPVCDPPISKVLLEENVPVGTLVTKLNVTDLDEGPNGDVEYSFKTSNNAPGKFTKLFSLDARTGEIRTKAPLDYEESSAYEIAIRARDKGSPAMEGHCHLRVELIDINDNSPEIVLTSVSSPVQEDAAPGTVIALIGVKDSDSGDNGQVRLQIAKELPFKLVSSFKEHFSLVTSGPLDREKASGYNITVRAVDSGSPQRATQKTFYLRIADVNDNAPNFSSPFDTAHVQENSLPGTSVFSVSASDPDEGSNAKLSYSILDNGMQDAPISTYFRIDQDNGTIYTVRALDYEQDKVFQVPVEQAQPNTDWRFSQTQRPGTSGSQNGEEAGAWPNNQFDTEMLQAMILASANEAADGNSTLGGGNGTMGLSARYGPQFTLQHVPDYRQNVYIPGSNATLTNAAGKRDAKNAAPAGGNKKKSGKKEKK